MNKAMLKPASTKVAIKQGARSSRSVLDRLQTNIQPNFFEALESSRVAVDRY